MPLRILKRQLLLAAARNNMLRCTESLRVVPGASRNTVQEIMHQLSNEKVSLFPDDSLSKLGMDLQFKGELASFCFNEDSLKDLCRMLWLRKDFIEELLEESHVFFLSSRGRVSCELAG